jgi:DNA-binding NarL/FixJ family response regulator
MSEQGPRRVLIVDDATLLRHLIAEGLRRRFPEIEFIEAEGVAEGYHRARQYQPRLAILDVSMPDGNGLDLARRFRDELPGTLVCICTLHDEPEFRQAAAESGAVSFIAKQGGLMGEAESLVRTVFPGAPETGA